MKDLNVMVLAPFGLCVGNDEIGHIPASKVIALTPATELDEITVDLVKEAREIDEYLASRYVRTPSGEEYIHAVKEALNGMEQSIAEYYEVEIRYQKQ